MGSPSDLSGINRSSSMSLIFESPISQKGAELGHILILNTNRKSYLGSPSALIYLPLKGYVQGH